MIDDADEHLVEQFLRRRDEGSFRKIYSAHTPHMYSLALRLVAGHREDAEDVVQETWIRAVKNLPRFQWQSRLRTWLCGILINCYREMRATRKTWNDLEMDPASEKEHFDQSIQLELLLKRLPDGYREVVVLHDIHGYTHAEIGERLGIQPGTSKSRLFEARKKLLSWTKGTVVPDSSGGVT